MNEMDMDMDIMEIVDMMEEAIEKASAVPLTGKVMIDKGELLDYIQEIRLVYPDELMPHNRSLSKLRLIQTNMLMTFLTTLNTDWTCYLEKFVRTEVISIITD